MEDKAPDDTKTVGSELLGDVVEHPTHENGDTNVASSNHVKNNAVEVEAQTMNGELAKSDLAKEVAEEDQGEMVVEAAEDTIIY
jgi:hypothetical protein